MKWLQCRNARVLIVHAQSFSRARRFLRSVPWRDSLPAPHRREVDPNSTLLSGKPAIGDAGHQSIASANNSQYGYQQSHSSLTLSSGQLLHQPSQSRDLSTSFRQLRYQAAVNGNATSGSRLVDLPEYRDNFRLWIRLLDVRLRLDGLSGAWDIWEGLRLRNVDIPTIGMEAEELWATFVSAAIQLNRLDELYQYARDLYIRTQQKYDLLYNHIMRHCFRLELHNVWPWHRKLQKIGLPAQGSLSDLVDLAVRSPKALNAFRTIYKKSSGQKIYDSIITALCDRGSFEIAAFWHELCLERQDFPSSAKVADPLRRHLALTGRVDRVSSTTQALLDSRTSFPVRAGNLRDNTRLSRTMMNELLGEVHGVKQKIISDEFCARSLATRAFTVDFVLGGLTAFGLRSIGPLAIRQIALRASSDAEFEQSIATIAKCGAKIKHCVFSDLVMRSIRERNQQQLKLILESDMHPDAFDDHELQKRLVHSCIILKDWRQLHLSLFILTSAHADRQKSAWNVLIRAYIDSRDWNSIQLATEDMLTNGAVLELKSIRHSFFALIPRRKPGRRLPSSPVEAVDPLDFVTSMWLRNMTAGGSVPALAWTQLHTLYGMENRLADVEHLSLWLAAHYSKKVSPAFNELEITKNFQYGSSLSPRQHRRLGRRFPGYNAQRHPLRQIFDTQRQCALVHWSFKSLGLPLSEQQQKKLSETHWSWRSQVSMSEIERPTRHWLERHKNIPIWARGVALLLRLRQYGVEVRTETVRKAVQQRLRIIWGWGTSNDKGNRIARRKYGPNVKLLIHMIFRLHKMWGGKLFPELQFERRLRRERRTVPSWMSERRVLRLIMLVQGRYAPQVRKTPRWFKKASAARNG